MTRQLSTPGIILTDRALRPEQEQAILESANAMSAFIGPRDSLPLSNYLTAYTRGGRFIGAVHLEERAPFSKVANIHPMLLERDRELFTEVTEAAIMWCLNNNLVPTARVLDDEAYGYMHKFLTSLQFHLSKQNGWRIYQLPDTWKPKSFASYTMEFA